MKKRSLDNRGFSLVEMIVAVLIMAIIAGMAIFAFSSIFGTKAKAAAKSVQDVFKQTRTEAIGLVNNPGLEGRTNVYTKLYMSDSTMYADICTDSSGSEVVLFTEKICSDEFKLEFYNVNDAGTESLLESLSASNIAYKVYFKKSTGGVSGIEKFINGSTNGMVSDVERLRLKIVSTSDSTNQVGLVLVNLTGRCYID